MTTALARLQKYGGKHSRHGPTACACHTYQSDLPLGGYLDGMCRSIVTLRRPDHAASDEEVRAAALQYVRKISGYRVPSKRNEAAFQAAVDQIADASHRLLHAVTNSRAP